VIVLAQPRPVQLVDTRDRPVAVTGGGMVSAPPARLSVDGGAWTVVTGWAGPWPAEERWWSAPRRRARMQIVTGVGTAHLLTRERGGWWLEGTYD
jgi:protein ImuB